MIFDVYRCIINNYLLHYTFKGIKIRDFTNNYSRLQNADKY